MSVYSSKTALLSGIIDYAGMFPPASLDLNATLKKAATFRRTSRHPWLLNRVVLGLNEIKQLNPRLLWESGSDGSPWTISALGTTPQENSTETVIKTIDWDLRELRRIQERLYHSSCRVDIVSYETRLPAEVSAPGQAITAGETVFPVLEQLETIWPGELDIYFEVSLGASWEETLEGVSRILAEWIAENSASQMIPALKIRTGGKQVPTPQQLAKAIDECAANGIKLKATQGLHHPVSQGSEFGFINLFAAINFAYSLGNKEFSLKDIETCLTSQKGDEFVFSESSFSWRGREITTQQIESARKTHAATFGSCSIDEPDEFLFKEFP
ncbi:hypothetical protein EBQ90_09630 [bacterium]|nr:hypothetical protein [bacterium]